MKDPSPRPKPRATLASKKKPRRRLGSLARFGLWACGAIVVIVVVFVFVFPTRTYLDQRHQLSMAAERIKVLDTQNQQLAAEAQKLQSADEIKRIARAQYHMVAPGAQAYVVLPAPAPPTTVAPAAPPSRHSGGWWHTLTSWLP